MLRGNRVMRIVWLPGTDLLQGECHCGATHVDEDPAAMWDWLLAHPVGHGGTESVTEERVLATVR
ncbi:hypothetical protein GCM10007304_35960 [Rhodococcoides trifolii]|uniref:Uncharacterized protein n=2 Tax=Rhodococcoides trifolii TaxID=908250 RepID=A0A917LFP8_9NOCA|nr:hypothetical protein [Rhodococcus trifolii]GGG18788.1 hypothetical protein GCM10007304_35960 [Rhodococcus trifolii]